MNKKNAVRIFLYEFLNSCDKELEDLTTELSIQIEADNKKIIFNEGENAKMMYYLVSGKIKLSKISLDGKETIIKLVEPNEIFAAVAACENDTYPVTATASEKSELLGFNINAINALAAKNHDFTMELFIYATDRIKYLLNVIDGLSSKNARGRLIEYLKNLSEKASENNETSFRLPLAKNELALLLGSTPETISRLFTKLRNEKIIEQNGASIKYLG